MESKRERGGVRERERERERKIEREPRRAKENECCGMRWKERVEIQREWRKQSDIGYQTNIFLSHKINHVLRFHLYTVEME